MSPAITLAVLLLQLPAVAGGIIVGHQKGRTWAGFFLALFFGLIGLLIIALTRPTEAEQIKRVQQAAHVRELAGVDTRLP